MIQQDMFIPAWKVNVDARAEEFKVEIRNMAESARRSVGQRIRRGREMIAMAHLRGIGAITIQSMGRRACE